MKDPKKFFYVYENVVTEDNAQEGANNQMDWLCGEASQYNLKILWKTAVLFRGKVAPECEGCAVREVLDYEYG